MTPRSLLLWARSRLVFAAELLEDSSFTREEIAADCRQTVAMIDACLERERAALAGLVVRRGAVSAAVRRFVLRRDFGLCSICFYPVEPREVHLDHEIPVCRGGFTEPSNLRVTHARCNLGKGGSLQ